MAKLRFTKCLSVFLSLCMVLSGLAFAARALEPVQDSEEQSAETEAVVTTELMEKGIKPGLNMLNQTTSEWTFEEGMTDYASVLSIGISGTHAVAANPVSDAVNSSASVLKLSVTAASYPAIAFNPPSMVESDRPVYLSFKYLKTYEPAAGETIKSEGALWIMKNGSSYVAKSVGGFDPNAGWKQYSGLIDFNKAYNAGNTSDINTSPISSIRIQAKALANDGKTIFAYDDIMMMPSYKISYMLNDGTDSVVSSSYFLFEEDGSTLMTSYAPDLTVKPADRYGYVFKGWSLNADSATADAPASVTLANEDIVLYAVWEKDEDAPEATTYKWDFEDNTTQTWSTANTGYSMTVQNGYITVNTNAAAYVGTPYLRHGGVSLDTKAHRYLVVKARSHDTVSNIKFYFKTSDMSSVSEAATVQIPIDQGSKVFKEYYVDMSQNALWTGNYQSCMFQFNKGSGIVDIEEIYFTTLYDQPEQQVFEYHYPNSKLSAWGHTAITTNDDGTVKITRSGTSNEGAMNIAAP
ncbi:MAG: InlB B-repeat-containing protein, partial [Eubacteriales bacterium]